MKTILSFILLILLVSCKQNETKSKEVEWDFTSKSFDKTFKDKEIRLLEMYDVFTFTKLSDSVIVLDGGIFQGWKNKSMNIKDTLKLTEKHFVLDSLGNKEKQILSYSKRNQIYFQLIVTKKEFTYLGFEETGEETSDKKTTEEKLITDVRFDYSGKLFIHRKDVQYFGEDLYTK